jgi:intron-binding protein aquarius
LAVAAEQVVGPPGTGKTDVAVQIIANLYHNCPNQKTLIVAHSNAALNDLFQKVTTYALKNGAVVVVVSGECCCGRLKLLLNAAVWRVI